MEDEALHRDFQRTHAEGFGLGQRLLVGPVIVSDTIAGDRGAGAVRPTPAVYEDGPGGIIIEQRKHRCDLRLLRRLVTAPRQANIAHSGVIDFRLFRPFTTQIDHGLNAKFCETFEALAMRLRPAINVFIHLMEVRNTRNVWQGCSLGPGDT